MGLPYYISAQVVINTTGDPADTSAMLDVQSTKKGVLIPRMNQNKRNHITNPATGLLIYQTDNGPGFYFYDGSAWVTLTGAHQIDDLSDGLTGGKSVFLGKTSASAGSKNVGVGNNALNSNTSGKKNTAIGFKALAAMDTLSNNTAIGFRALERNAASRNTAVGFKVMSNNTSGYQNVAFGEHTMYRNTTGAHNTAVGVQALDSVVAGNYNTAIGIQSHRNSHDYYNSTGIGFGAMPTGSNQVRLGNSSVNSIGGYAAWTTLSDGRFKTDVMENVVGLDFIMKLRPVTYHLDMDALAKFLHTPDDARLPAAERQKAAELHSGFIAQEVEQAAREAGYDFHGVDAPDNENDHYGLRYAEFVVPLVKAVQELNDKQEQETQSLQKAIDEQQQEIDEIKALIEKYSKKSK